MKFPVENKFSLDYYSSILLNAKSKGYKFMTMREIAEERPDLYKNRICVLRHDLDDKPYRLRGMIDCEDLCGVKSSIFILIHTDKYNFLSYPTLSFLREIESKGFEIGLHTNFVEVAQIAGIEPQEVLTKEMTILRQYFNIVGIACHRNIDYMYNSLPYVENHWGEIKSKNNLAYQAYCTSIFGDLVFVNEGFVPHLGWRSNIPEDVIRSGKSFCLSTHPHWWHNQHAFEN